MSRKYQFMTEVLNNEDINEIFNGVLKELKEKFNQKYQIQYGFAWGNWIYEKDWKYLIKTPDEILSEVKMYLDKKDGKIGSDDFYIKTIDENLEITFCHESDVHIEYDIKNDLVQAIEEIIKNKSILKIMENDG